MNTNTPVFIDFETASKLAVTDVGAYVYAQHPSTEVLSVSCILPGDDTAISLASPQYGGNLGAWDALRTDLAKCMHAGHLFVAHNAGFDRNIYWHVYDPDGEWALERERWVRSWICSAVLARRACYPSALHSLARALGTTPKDDSGKYYIKQLSDKTKPRPDNWRELMDGMVDYGRTDAVVLKEVFERLFPYALHEWEAWWASELVNDAGLPIDRALCGAGRDLSECVTAEINERLRTITGEMPTFKPDGTTMVRAGMTLGNHTAKTKWMVEQLGPYPELLGCIRKAGRTEDGEPKYGLDEHARTALEEALDGPGGEALPTDVFDGITDFLEALREGQGAAAAKFKAMLQRCSDDGRLRGAYWFDGAGATGRFSSKGAQMHNLVNQTLDSLDDVIGVLLNGQLPPEEKANSLRGLSDLGLATTLGRCVRPAIAAPKGQYLVWGDFSGIEARGLPWLADSSGGYKRLAAFEQGVDFYCQIASVIFGKVITKAEHPWERQVGKGVELGSGYGGGVGAFRKTARKFGIKGIDDATIKRWVEIWREENEWARTFWYDIRDAVAHAHAAPGQWFPAGRLAYRYVPALLGGSMLCRLPSGRFLIYAHFGVEWEDTDWGRRRAFYCKRFRRGQMRKVKLWHGTFVENATQAACNDILRHALVQAVKELHVIGHTHDEIIVQGSYQRRGEYIRQLEEIMKTAPEWAKGFPLKVDVSHGKRYEKKD